MYITIVIILVVLLRFYSPAPQYNIQHYKNCTVNVQGHQIFADIDSHTYSMLTVHRQDTFVRYILFCDNFLHSRF